MYATGVPFSVTLITVILEFLPKDSYAGVRPNFGMSESCFFETPLSNLLFFHLLLMMVEVTNVIFFILVATKMHKNWKSAKQIRVRRSIVGKGSRSQKFKGVYPHIYYVVHVKL